MNKFVYIGNSQVEILGIGKVNRFGGEIDVPDDFVELWKRPGGPIMIPVAKFAELEKDQAACLEYLQNVRSGGDE